MPTIGTLPNTYLSPLDHRCPLSSQEDSYAGAIGCYQSNPVRGQGRVVDKPTSSELHLHKCPHRKRLVVGALGRKEEPRSLAGDPRRGKPLRR